MEKMTIAERRNFEKEFSLSCSVCQGAINTLVTGCTSIYCPSNREDPQFKRN